MVSPTDNNGGRDERGRFGKGNSGGPGGSRQRAEFRRAMAKAVTPEIMEAMIRRAARMALEGNLRATEFIVNQLAGRPGEAPPEPQALPLVIPSELNTAAACAAATEEVIAAHVQGKIDWKNAKLLLDGIKTRFQILKETQDREGEHGEVAPVRSIPPEVLRALFRHFKKTGELPYDVEEAAAVVWRVVDGQDLIDAPGDEPSAGAAARDGFVRRHREKDDGMDGLLWEAVDETGLPQAIARNLLRGYAKAGLDLTRERLTWFKLPEFGTIGMALVGFELRLVRKPYKAQARRLLRRADRLRRAQPRDRASNRKWVQKVEDAHTCFVLEGVLPEDGDVLEGVLVLRELDALMHHFIGLDVSDLMPLYDAAATTTGDERAKTLSRLQAKAKAGRMQPPDVSHLWELAPGSGAPTLPPPRDPPAGEAQETAPGCLTAGDHPGSDLPSGAQLPSRGSDA